MLAVILVHASASCEYPSSAPVLQAPEALEPISHALDDEPRATESSVPDSATEQREIRRDEDVLGSRGAADSSVQGVATVSRTAPVVLATKEQLATWSSTLDSIARTSSRGEETVAMRRQIVFSLSAPSIAEMNSRLRRLPVDIADETLVQDGRPVRRRSYRVRGVERLSLRLPSSLPPAHGPGEATDAIATGPSADIGLTVLAVNDGTADCEYTAPTGEHFSGACASQEDIDAAAMALAAMDAELGLQNQQVVAGGGCIPDFPFAEEPCVPIADHDDGGRAELLAVALGDFGGGPASRVSGPSQACGIVDGALPPHAPWAVDEVSCVAELLDTIYGITAYVGSKVGALAVMGMANPPASAVAFAVAGALGSGYAAARVMFAYYRCVAEQ